MLKRAAIDIMVKHLETKEVDKLRAEFELIDTDGSGFIEAGELKLALSKQDSKITEQKINDIIDQLDF